GRRIGGHGRGQRPLAVEQVGVGGHHAAPDDPGLDVTGDDHGPQRDVAAHAVAPHAHALRVGVGEGARGPPAVEHVDDVVAVAVWAARLALGAAVAAIGGAKDDVAAAGEVVDVLHVALGRAVLLRRDVDVVENDDRPARGGSLAVGHGQQGVDFVAVRQVGGDEAVVVVPRLQFRLDGQRAAGVVAAAHHLDHQRV